jgi:uncharacterized membrane protein YadS
MLSSCGSLGGEVDSITGTRQTRNALIGFVVLGFALYWAARGQADEIAPGAKAKAVFIWEKFPRFVLGFLAVSAIATVGWLSKGQTANLANVSKWAFLLTFAGVGLNTDIRQSRAPDGVRSSLR